MARNIVSRTKVPQAGSASAADPSKITEAASLALQAEIAEMGAVNVINNRLGHARATLDLISTMTSYADCDLESLDRDTLNYAVDGAIRQIDEAVKAAEAV